MRVRIPSVAFMIVIEIDKIKDQVRIVLDEATVLYLSKNHRVLINREGQSGISLAKNIKIGDDVVQYENIEGRGTSIGIKKA